MFNGFVATDESLDLPTLPELAQQAQALPNLANGLPQTPKKSDAAQNAAQNREPEKKADLELISQPTITMTQAVIDLPGTMQLMPVVMTASPVPDAKLAPADRAIPLATNSQILPATPLAFSLRMIVPSTEDAKPEPAPPAPQAPASPIASAARIISVDVKPGLLTPPAPITTTDNAQLKPQPQQLGPGRLPVTDLAEAVDNTSPKVSQPAPQSLGDHSTHQPAAAQANAQPEPSIAQQPRTPTVERAAINPTQQHSTQQEQSNGQNGSSDSKSQTPNRRDETSPRLQVRSDNNPIAFEPSKPNSAVSPSSAGNTPPATKTAPSIETNPPAPTQPTRQISMKLEGADSKQVAIQLTERAGRVQVAVRTADHELAKSLQGDLGDLVSRLENKGIKTEAWVPATTARHAAPVSFDAGNQTNNQGQSGGQGSGTGQEPGRQGQNGSNQRQQQPRWNAQLEETLNESGKEEQ